jgi:hypothetical protein
MYFGSTMFDALLSQLETDLRAALGSCVTELVITARAQLKDAHADVAEERAKGLAEVAEERANALAEENLKRAELGREFEAMHTHKEAQERHIVLNIGGYRFETSVQTLRRVPHTFFDAYFSGRYAQDVCNDGSIFVDRDGEHFGHVLEYMRTGVVAVAEDNAHPSVSLLRSLKREFGFYCIELSADEPAAQEHPEMAFVMGGIADNCDILSSMEQYDAVSGVWSAVADMGTRRRHFGACAIAGEVYVTGGMNEDDENLMSIEKYSPSNDVWSTVEPLPEPRSQHASVSVDAVMYVLGGIIDEDDAIIATASVLKYDSVQGTWEMLAPMPEPRRFFATCVIASNIYVFGGEDEENVIQGSVFKYDTEADKWSTLAPMPTSESGNSAIELGGLIYIVGIAVHGLLCFNPTSGAWSTLHLSNATSHDGASFVLGGCLYAAGGEDSESNVQRYDVTTNAWIDVGHMLEGRDHFVAVTVGSAGAAEEQDLFDSLIAKASK